MIWLYRLLFLPALLLALPHYLGRMRRRGGYGRDFHHRFGSLPELPEPEPGVTRIWIQAVSVGEINTLPPLLAQLREQLNCEFVVTTTTSTGYTLLREKLDGECRALGQFPIDFWPFSARAWNRLKPTLALLMEGELWPEHLQQARRRNVPVALVNARLSDKSFRRYQKVAPFAKALFGQLGLILAGSAHDAERFGKLLGNAGPGIHLTGNLKADAVAPEALDDNERLQLRAELGFAPGSLVLLGASTWPGEEQLLVDLLKQWREAHHADLRLLLIPRHAERRQELADLCQSSQLAWHQRSKHVSAPAGTLLYLADTTGEMPRLMQAADLAYIGKSLPPNDGGQTPVEAAALGLPMVYGPAMSNFKDLCRSLEATGGALRGTDAQAIGQHLKTLLGSLPQRQEAGARAKAWHQAQQGAARRTAAHLQSAFGIDI